MERGSLKLPTSLWTSKQSFVHSESQQGVKPSGLSTHPAGLPVFTLWPQEKPGISSCGYLFSVVLRAVKFPSPPALCHVLLGAGFLFENKRHVALVLNQNQSSGELPAFSPLLCQICGHHPRRHRPLRTPSPASEHMQVSDLSCHLWPVAL